MQDSIQYITEPTESEKDPSSLAVRSHTSEAEVSVEHVWEHVWKGFFAGGSMIDEVCSEDEV